MSRTIIEEPAQSVLKPPGSTTITFTPNGAVSARRTRLKPSMANVAAWYHALPGEPPTRPPMEENLCVPRTLSMSCDQVIFVYQTADASLPFSNPPR